MRIAIGQVAHETNTFSAVQTTVETFQHAEWAHGDKVITNNEHVKNYLGGMIQKGNQLNVDLLPTFSARCNPSGLVTKKTFETLRDELIKQIYQVGDIDALCLALHGAGVAENYPDLEGELLRAIRHEFGDNLPIVVSLDLHGNLTELMVEQATALVGVKEYPHIDTYEAGAKAMQLTVDILQNKIKPVMKIKQIPLLMFPNTTFQQPAKAVKEYTLAKEAQSGVLECAFYHGFARADTKYTGASIVTITDDQSTLAEQTNKDVATYVWQRREEFINDYLDPHSALKEALATESRPVIVNETSDNPGSGAPGDGTHLLKAFIEQNIPQSAFGFIYDPEVAEIAHQAGVGAVIDIDIGGKTDDLHGSPLAVKAYVKSITDGRFIQSAPMNQGAQIDFGQSARLKVGEVDIIVASGKSQTLDKEIFLLHGIDIKEYKIIALKSCQHFRAGFEPYAAHIITADSPGISTSQPKYYNYQAIERPIFPLDQNISFG